MAKFDNNIFSLSTVLSQKFRSISFKYNYSAVQHLGLLFVVGHSAYDLVAKFVTQMCFHTLQDESRPICYHTNDRPKTWEQQHQWPTTSLLVRSVGTRILTRRHCLVCMRFASHVLKDNSVTSYREIKHLVPCVERNFRFHQKELTDLSIISLFSSCWS